MHEQFLLQALLLAQKGQGSCAPNPSVGAIAVRKGDIIAQAWHQGAGTAHAEQLVLAQIAPKTPGVSLYITLEPCNHWGRTPPCVDAIIEHGIEEVIFSYSDPNPLVAQNNSSALLRAKGIKVTQLPLDEIKAFYQSYHHWIVTKKPWVTAKIAQSLDGKIAGPKGQPLQLSNELCKEFTHQMRSKSDVIFTSAKTIVLDNSRLNVRLQGIQKSKPVAIIDSHLSLKGNERVFKSASHCIIYHLEGVEGRPYPNSTLKALPTMDLDFVMTDLGKQGFHDLWVEAGGELFTSLHLQGLVNRTYVYVVPKFLGQEAVSSWKHLFAYDKAFEVSWRLMEDNVIACLNWTTSIN